MEHGESQTSKKKKTENTALCQLNLIQPQKPAETKAEKDLKTGEKIEYHKSMCAERARREKHSTN